MAKDKVNLILADKVYEMGATEKIWGQTIPVDRMDAFCQRHPHHVGGTAANWFRNLKQDMMKAEKICLSDDFVRLVVHQQRIVTIQESVERTTTRLKLARNPFPITWIEWDSKTLFREKLRTARFPSLLSIEEPYRLGYLLRSTTDDGSLYNCEEFSIIEMNESSMVFPYKVFVNTEAPVFHPPIRQTHTGEKLVSLNAQSLRSAFLLGNTSHMLGTDHHWASRKRYPAVLDQIALDYTDIAYSMKFRGPNQDKMQSHFNTEVFQSSGIGGFIFTALALINEAVIEYRYTMKPSGRRFVHGKPLPYMAHRTVHIEVPGSVKHVVRYYDRLLKHAEIRHRAHQVRGFWRTLNKDTKDERKVWIKPHVRGDESLGWVHQDHIVTSKNKVD